jgi:hypothetical protein
MKRQLRCELCVKFGTISKWKTDMTAKALKTPLEQRKLDAEPAQANGLQTVFLS